ncbi:geranylgeranylglycerol-phosphate geranylgeranyltransferase [Raphidocelis subcapitata]|uniref:Geranylgeranylglycerol-phosphate geranylgeranyltransferase n=1 Tax=Raphidocelis subcapitata TaxID=307507 RepID=A0A2V0P9S4_9CHLO|nr:geranylgeranylglycerol-phosphate geranylgeranyltransferase [Raphidocelis subcapitata]|eukprot:GBF96608.1 geranylgeranylglycerol-phosphate geranylgeranyltransferase [Raphidocelis subcapitata]
MQALRMPCAPCAPHRAGRGAPPRLAPLQPRPQSGRAAAAAAPPAPRRGGVAARVAAGAGPAASFPDHWDSRKAGALLRLARIHNLAPSTLLVAVGACAGSGSLAALRSPVVWLMALLSGGIAVSSCVVNDYFDLRVDLRNAPDKPLASGAITTDAALLLSSALYCGVLIVACFMEPTQLRSIVALSAAATLLYTPIFKRLTAVKNATVAAVIALAPLAGALAAGAGEAGARRLLPAVLWAFGGILYREILMDVTDAEGDAANGIKTLPVVLGPRAALAAATACAAAGAAAAASAAAAAAPAAAAAGAPAAAAAVVALCGARLLHLSLRVLRSGFDRRVLDQAISGCLKPVGLGIVLLAALAA